MRVLIRSATVDASTDIRGQFLGGKTQPQSFGELEVNLLSLLITCITSELLIVRDS